MAAVLFDVPPTAPAKTRRFEWSAARDCKQCGYAIFDGVDDRGGKLAHVNAQGRPVRCRPPKKKRGAK